MKKFGDKINQVRAEESRQLKVDGYEPILKNARWCLLKLRENLTGRQTVKLKDMAKTLRSHRELLLNWFRARGEVSNGSAEGMNIKAKLAMRKAYGFKSY